MRFKVILLIGAVVPSFAIYASGEELNKHSNRVVAQATQPNSADTEKDKDKRKKTKTPSTGQQKSPPSTKQKPAQVQPPPQLKKKEPVVQQPKPSLQQQTNKPKRPAVQQPVQTQQPVTQSPAQVQQQVRPPSRKLRPSPQQSQGVKPQQPAQAQPNSPQPQQAPTAQQKPGIQKNTHPMPVIQTQQQPTVSPESQRLDQVRGARREVREGNRTVIQEQNRTIVRENGHTFVRHDDLDRFRYGARDVQVVRHGRQIETVIIRPDGIRIITIVDADGRLVRRVRRDRFGHEWVLINNAQRGPGFGFIAGLAPPVIHIPRNHYIVEADRADMALIYATLIAPPVMRVDRAYALDEIRYTNALRERMPRIDLDTITFDTGSWYVAPDQVEFLRPIADAMLRAIQGNPNEIYLVEGHTDAVGSDIDNLSLSDRRAEAVAAVLTQNFGVPPENLTTQGYGEQYLKVPTQGPERQNRRVTVRRITPLLNPQTAQPQ
jgi:outer membrane protein OmpA-like peptidoglycan-associated protein